MKDNEIYHKEREYAIDNGANHAENIAAVVVGLRAALFFVIDQSQSQDENKDELDLLQPQKEIVPLAIPFPHAVCQPRTVMIVG